MLTGPPAIDRLRADDVTALLRRWRAGDAVAGRSAIGRVYADLRRLAAHELARERESGLVQPTELVHEVYLRLAGRRQPNWQDRGHFFAIASRLVRQVLVDQARARNSRKRGGGAPLAPPPGEAPGLRPVDVLALDQALERLAAANPPAAAVVELRYFAGLTVDETAAALGLARATVERKWRAARAWLSGVLATAPEADAAAAGETS